MLIISILKKADNNLIIDESFLFCLAELLYPIFKPGCFAAVICSLVPHHFQWSFAAQWFCPFTLFPSMLIKSPLQVGRNARVKISVPAADHVNPPLLIRWFILWFFISYPRCGLYISHAVIMVQYCIQYKYRCHWSMLSADLCPAVTETDDTIINPIIAMFRGVVQGKVAKPFKLEGIFNRRIR